MDALIPVEMAPTDPRASPLVDRHLALMRSQSPACSVHAMAAADMAEARVRFFAILDGGRAVAMGALKRLSGGQGEIKSMHVRDDLRGRGLADRILGQLLAAAAEEGLTRLSLETGSQPAFAAARAFYARHGFVPCAPFEGYREDPNSVFMTRPL